MSIGFLLENPDDAIIWRGPKKNGSSPERPLWKASCAANISLGAGMIKQFLRDVSWGELDYLIVDTPPGTSDEHLSITQYLKETNPDGAIIITTPQVRRSCQHDISYIPLDHFCAVVPRLTSHAGGCTCRCAEGNQLLQEGRSASARRRGEHERLCMPQVHGTTSLLRLRPHGQQTRTEIFVPTTGGAEKMCRDMSVPFLGKVPIDPRLARACDEGQNYCALYPDAPGVKALMEIVSSALLRLSYIY